MEINKKPFFTVFIGLYNSEKVIHRFFESVKNQTFRDFELIIIDDCSQDKTVQITEDFLSTIQDIDVTFIKHKENKGIAFSRSEALHIGKGELFVKWDHDDIQDKKQLEEFKLAYLKHKDQNVAAVWCLCKDMEGKVVGNEYPKNEVIGNYLSMYSKYILSTLKDPKERHNCINLKVHKKVNHYLYEKKIINKSLNPTATDLWSALALMNYNTVYINKSLRQYFIENDRPRMSNSGREANAERTFIDRCTWINHYLKKLPKGDLIWRIRLYSSINQYGIISGKNLSEILKPINSLKHKLIILLFHLPIKLIVKLR